MRLSLKKCRFLSAAVGGPYLTLDQVPAGFFVLAFGAFAGAGGGPGARSIDTKRPPVKR
jgi:hypothetical protein